jgi:hypothetical protein
MRSVCVSESIGETQLCVGHGLLIEGESPLRGLSEVTVSESSCMTARKCEMEAVYESQHRTKVNLGTGYVGWVSVRCITTPGQSHVRSMNNLRVASQLQSYPSHIAYVYLELHL